MFSTKSDFCPTTTAGRWEISFEDVSTGFENIEVNITYLEIFQLLINDSNHLKALTIGDRVHENVSMNTNGVLGGKERVFVLSSRVDYRNIIVDTLVRDLFLIGVFDGWVVWLHKVIFDEFNDEGRLS